MRKVFKKVLTFAFLFGIITMIIPKSDALAQNSSTTINPIFETAVENIRFYSSFNNQTLTQDRLSRLTTDFFLPTNYQDISISYIIDSSYLEIAEETEIILLRAGTEFVEQEVYRVSIIKSPNILKGEQPFIIYATFNYENQYYTHEYNGFITPVIPEDFFGGTLFTFIRYGKMFFDGAVLTIGISLTGTIIGFVLALFLATAKLMQVTAQDKRITKIIKTIVNKSSSLYITIFRGTPMIVQASFFWYGFGLFGNALLCGLFVVSLNTAAYIAEIIRGGINAIDKGQTEASLSVGLTYTQTMLFVIFPQAIKNSMPAIGNEFVINIKDTAVLSVIGIFELFNQTRKITGMHYRQLEAYVIVAVIYLFLTYSTTSTLKLIEKRMGLKPIELTSSN